MIGNIYKAFMECNRKISTDTRNIIPGSIFFALKGDRFDGNKFVREAFEKGASYCVVDNPDSVNNKTFLVENVTATLQNLARHYRKRCDFNIIAITGTNGKTTTKELIYSVLSAKYNCSATQGNLNNHLGVPLTILSTHPETELLIVEMGANHVGEIKTLCEIANPDIGIITNIGKAHLEGFGGFENVIKAKSELYQYLIKRNLPIFVNGTDKLLMKIIKGYPGIFSYGDNNSQCYASKIKFSKTLLLEVSMQNKSFKISTKLFGRYNIDNVLAALRIGQYFKVNSADAIHQIENYTPKNNRSQIKQTQYNTLILDSYNANPTSMNAALDSFLEIDTTRKMIVFGEMNELGEYSTKEHQILLDRLSDKKTINSYFIGEKFRTGQHYNAKIFTDTDEFISFIKSNKPKQNLILLKGSRTNGLEKLVDYL
jgi:UDP-N-acetylmuramoyl-tripeptide--D-alanyl-D-alanine ligase